ncbi:hypothetical protein JZ751_002912 [Albula glossodonta]|uniref:Ataxin-3 n=1 Tax=Albula glossodonta TaxID=121402 RepID=A0A8T2N881_9TELE|nr:hypothetical protein JZ751_002912 [Albula glossodonta]
MSVQRMLEAGQGLEEGVLDEDEEELRKALALSRQDMEVEDEEADLRRAIQLSMLGAAGSSTPSESRDVGVVQLEGSTPMPASAQNENLTAEELRESSSKLDAETKRSQ